MAKYRKKSIVVEATQWFCNGDHPQDESKGIIPDDGPQPFLSEGEVVRRYRSPHGLKCINCHCETPAHDHGWIDTLEGGYIVCPGDFIITGVKGERYPCKPDIFKETYDSLEIINPNDGSEEHVRDYLNDLM